MERNIGSKHHFSQPPRFGMLDMNQQELCFKVLVGGWVICYFFLRAYFDDFMELTLVVNFTWRQAENLVVYLALHIKLSFPLWISSVNVIKSAENSRFGDITEEIRNRKLCSALSSSILLAILTINNNTDKQVFIDDFLYFYWYLAHLFTGVVEMDKESAYGLTFFQV